jgi:hypothetical protein
MMPATITSSVTRPGTSPSIEARGGPVPGRMDRSAADHQHEEGASHRGGQQRDGREHLPDLRDPLSLGRERTRSSGGDGRKSSAQRSRDRRRAKAEQNRASSGRLRTASLSEVVRVLAYRELTYREVDRRRTRLSGSAHLAATPGDRDRLKPRDKVQSSTRLLVCRA